MSLDQNLFTLAISPSKDDADAVDLVDSTGVPHYRKRRVHGLVYKMEMYDPMSQSLLITATAPNATSKHKTLELYNPTLVVELKYVGTLTFKWGFKWEEHDFEWKREECFMIRKPDPPVLVAVTKVSPGRLKTSSIQILDYNLNRFDINDRKGLEIVLLTALLTFQDMNEVYHTRDESTTATTPPKAMSRQVSDTAPPIPPPKPAPKTGIDRIAEMQRARGEHNEITVEDEGKVNDYAQFCSNLLQDDAMLFVTLRSAAADQVPKVLQVVEQTKRIRHKAGLSDEEDLHQYVRYDTTATGQKGPRRINLDDDNKNRYAPPKSLTVHLSKISMPELQPKKTSNEKEGKKAEGKFKKRDEKERAKDGGKRAEKKVPPFRPEPNKLARPATSHARVPSHQQPSPSPSQLNSPTTYAAPTPARPVSSHAPRYGPNLSLGGGSSLPQPQQPPSGPLIPAEANPVRQSMTPSAVVAGIFDLLHRRT